MNDEIIFREYIENDLTFLTDIVIKVWGFDDMLSEKNAKLIAELNLYSFLNTASFAKIALKDNIPVGFLVGKIINSKQNNIYENKIKEIKSKISKNIEGIISLLVYKKIKSINNNLYKQANKNYDAELSFFAVSKDCQGLGIGKKLFQEFNYYLKENNINDFYLYTDTYCNYKFYEHFEMHKNKEKHFSIPFTSKFDIDFYLYDKEL
ncbi:GNAT family N-acetyltransferase [Brachyspira hyodysenteriae]|uniref:GNAT family N-acetyltransferase n=1 Tax=Brachyspira hyodysenteriae TaxID=159 RepID=UPI00063D8F34|nr:GNAT family N-acetyltransferase [Brachyspira hyodysenteriae]KLI15022.1 GNAT family acetyltransferase [Brachyspira hyodysenteriae]KLI62182.1 GNAT family acetyltransferase [Brachyspira hyodysenteriae]MDA0033909.1 GNAT family N-acetyltransferase [Brachyspira hyodysenteriae]MDA0047980.1 GNAT family N-acetyltransferase [Brachyspira hyodysenteriae]MDA1468660.1 GNAT family N-acetyltransferase [Brachyspira hyodysenteriae]